MRKLYRVTCRGMLDSHGIAYVIASNAQHAYNLVRQDLDDRDLGVSNKRELDRVELVAEDAAYPDCGRRLYVEKGPTGMTEASPTLEQVQEAAHQLKTLPIAADPELLRVQVLGLQIVLGDLLAAVGALQQENDVLHKTRVEIWEKPDKWVRWCDIRILERAEAAEAQLQALHPYLRHKRTCNLSGGMVETSPGFMVRKDLMPGYKKECTCGLATLTQPGAASPERT